VNNSSITGAALLALLTGSFASASDFQSPRTAALGGAGHAGPMLNDSIYLNPSYASFLQTYSISLNYLRFKGPATEPDGSSFYHGHYQNVSIQDGRTEVFQAGMGFTRQEDSRMVHVGASKTAIKQLGFGLGAKFILPNNSNDRIQDLTFSTTGIISGAFQAVFIIDNLLQSAAGKERGLYREYILGTKLNLQSIAMIYFDPHFTGDASGTGIYGQEAGLEFTIMSDLFLRLGAFRNSKAPFQQILGRGYGAGFGWIAPRLSMDFAISRVIAPIPATSQVFGMTMYF